MKNQYRGEGLPKKGDLDSFQIQGRGWLGKREGVVFLRERAGGVVGG